MIGAVRGWWGAEAAASTAWSIPWGGDPEAVRDRLSEALDSRFGFAVVAGFPVDASRPEESADAAAHLLGGIGRLLLQGPPENATPRWLVRDEGTHRFRSDGGFRRGVYTSKSRDVIDIHNDGAMRPYDHEIDVSALLCVESAEEGGRTTLVSAVSAMEVLRREAPDQFALLCRPFPFERTHVTPPGGSTVVRVPVFEVAGPRPRVHWNRQRIDMAELVTGTPLPAAEVAALDALDEVLARPGLRYAHTLRPGELLVLDDRVVLHGRGSFTDGARRRCLVRMLLARD
ncbi:TauD/TfdA family dioxygenase [Kitasatospora sp. NPDC058965]|uniref:TauD/TfdA family dioxygenase n=1 Tax=Kitasatospora sp. NPDC058965 TaxID=3346682 RepID=UPI0036813257